jgi:uncharacterized protein YbdZ (MbtH family)
VDIINFSNPDSRSEDDLKTIMKVAIDLGYLINAQEAYEVWNKWSDMFAAGWLFVDNDEEIRAAVQHYFNI